MCNKSILQIGLTYSAERFTRLKEQNNLLEFHGLAEIREAVSNIPPSVLSSTPPPKKTQ